MGAWGHGIFENDHDQDIICELNDEAGLKKLQEATEQRVKDNKLSPKEYEWYVKKALPVYYTICGGYEAQEEIRKHLDSGVLEAMFAKKDQEVLQAKADAYIDPRYEFCILGACAMTLGCRISQQNKMLMQKHFLHGQMMETTERQLFEALNGPDGYQEGVPYHFEVPEDVEAGHEAEMKAREARAEATGGVVMLNVPAPGGFFGIPPKNKVWRSLMEEGKYGPAGCGGCGADKKEDGTELLRCGKCKKRGYCGVDCQKDHWKLHKKMCTAATGGAKENGKPTVTTMADAA